MVSNEQGSQGALGVWTYIEQADTFSHGILAILVLMSLASWYVILVKFWDQSRIRKSYAEARKKFWSAGNVYDGMASLSGPDNVYRMLAEDGVRAAQYHQGHMTEQVSLNDWTMAALHRSADSVSSRLSSSLAILATTGSVSPFIGLLGTVWGIYHALTTIAATGQAPIDKIAGPIGEALIMTAIGLFVAVPAVIGYNWLLRRNKTIQETMKHFATDVHTWIVGGARMDTAAPIARPGALRTVAAKAS